MGPSILKKRRIDDVTHGKASRPQKKVKKQLEYHSSSDEKDDPITGICGVNLQDSDSDNDGSIENVELPKRAALASNAAEEGTNASDSEDDSDSSSHSASSQAPSHTESTAHRKSISKRNDPAAFSTSISKILGTKLSTSARADPLLSRSKSIAQATADIANERLEKRARAKLRAEKKEELERGRIKDVMGVERGEAGETAEQERRLRKVAQRGVVKLFNAVRAAQVRGEEVAREERRKRATVGMGEREKKVNEVSKQGFLELINGKSGRKVTIEEA
ncbi:pre-60S ribosomal particles component [Emydomyces testavorans]|uniref:Pre-60S ribosomal particles component n=1 Tax=Emydomyces testavorans TaxID=2070801 RepID=A0AAF0DCN9_9EURO|nr:pre-60S ribosomal particles component [Emydomyces testavorans]